MPSTSCVFLPAATSHAAELKDSDESTVKWEEASKEDKTDYNDKTYQVFTFPSENYKSYEDAVDSLSKRLVDAVADRKTDYFWVCIPFSVVTNESIDENYVMSTAITDKINNWLRFGNNLTKKEIISFSGSDGFSHENLSSFSPHIYNWEKTENGYSGLVSCEIKYQTKYDYDTYEKEYFDAVKEMDVAGKVKLKLSDAFQIPDDSGEFEWTATMLNINYGHNQELLKKCQPLYEYAHFIKLIREYSETMGLKKAIDEAVEKAREWECIGTFLYQCKSEVSVMLLTEFDEKKHEDSLIKLGKEEGKEEERHERMREMITMDFPIESIATLYKVTVEYVLNLKKELENKATI